MQATCPLAYTRQAVTGLPQVLQRFTTTSALRLNGSTGAAGPRNHALSLLIVGMSMRSPYGAAKPVSWAVHVWVAVQMMQMSVFRGADTGVLRLITVGAAVLGV